MKVLKKLPNIYLIVGLVIVSCLVSHFADEIEMAFASSKQLLHTTQQDFTQGTIDSTLEINQSPGEIKLNRNLETLADINFTNGIGYNKDTKTRFDVANENFRLLVVGSLH